MSTRVLVVLPHPDDEAFGLAGTLAQLVSEGAQVTYACLTLGEMGRNMGFPLIANRVTLPSIRRQELQESCRAIGIKDLRMLGFHDKTIEFEDKEQLDGRIRSLIEELRPTLVITFYPGYAVHPDHDACGAAVIRTIASLPAAERPVVHCMAFSKDSQQALGKPDIVRDVRAFIEPKMASIQAHRSQFQTAEWLGSAKPSDKDIQERFGTERFWTYQFS